MWNRRVLPVTILMTLAWSFVAKEGHAASLSTDNRQGVSLKHKNKPEI